MSVNQKSYLVVGINLDKKDYPLMEEFEDNKDLTVVYDGMCGQYAIVGKVINESDEFNSMNLVSLNSKELQDYIIEVNQLLLKVSAKVSKYEIKLYNFIHEY